MGVGHCRSYWTGGSQNQIFARIGSGGTETSAGTHVSETGKNYYEKSPLVGWIERNFLFSCLTSCHVSTKLYNFYFGVQNLTTDKEAGKLDESTTPTVLDVADEQDRVEPTKIPSNNALYNLEDGSKTISAGGADYGCDDDVCAICLEPHVDDAGKQVSV